MDFSAFEVGRFYVAEGACGKTTDLLALWKNKYLWRIIEWDCLEMGGNIIGNQIKGTLVFGLGFLHILAKYVAKIVRFRYNNGTGKGVVLCQLRLQN